MLAAHERGGGAIPSPLSHLCSNLFCSIVSCPCERVGPLPSMTSPPIYLVGQPLGAARERGEANILSPLFFLYSNLLCFLIGPALELPMIERGGTISSPLSSLIHPIVTHGIIGRGGRLFLPPLSNPYFLLSSPILGSSSS